MRMTVKKIETLIEYVEGLADMLQELALDFNISTAEAHKLSRYSAECEFIICSLRTLKIIHSMKADAEERRI